MHECSCVSQNGGRGQTMTSMANKDNGADNNGDVAFNTNVGRDVGVTIVTMRELATVSLAG